MQPQNIERDDFDFSKKVAAKIDKQIEKIDYSSYKKLAFFAIAIGVFVSSGVYFGNHLVPTLVGSTNIVSTLAPSNEMVKNLNLQTSSLTPKDFDITNQYYQHVMNMYDTKFDYVNKTLIAYNLQTYFTDTEITNSAFVSMASKVNDHKEKITEILTKISTLKNKIMSKESLSYHEAQFLLNSVNQAKNHTYYQNTAVEEIFNKNLISTHKDITKYLMAQNVYDKIKVLDNDIKESFNNISINNANGNNANDKNTQIQEAEKKPKSKM